MNQFIVCEIVNEKDYKYHALDIVSAANIEAAFFEAWDLGYDVNSGKYMVFDFQKMTNNM